MSINLKFFLVVVFFCISQLQTFSQTFTSSNLPIVVISTSGQTIVDDPKITANMGIIWNGTGKRNSLTDTPNNYNGKVGIEIRGSSSQMFPKKSYGFETKSNDLANVDVSLLGLPKENDWVLYAPYTDKTMIRDVLTYTLDASLGHYTPRCRYVELVLNNQYQGVYVLMEKIKRNKNRVDIAKLLTTDNSGEDLTGGYIIKVDKTTGGDKEGFYSSYPNYYRNTLYLYDYPKQEDITSAQKTYIQTYVRNMENAIYSEKFTGAGSYHEYLNDTSCIDFMIINELSKNVDGYRLSSYLYKGKNDVLRCGPIWDFNLGYGNANYYNGWDTYGFQYKANLISTSGMPDDKQNPFWWNWLTRDQAYVTKLKKRWSTLRKKELSDQRINFVTDSLVNLLSEARDRNYQKWTGVIGRYIWPNYYVGYSYDTEVTWLKNWITQRLAYLDQEWKFDFTGEKDLLATRKGFSYPNPFTNQLTIELKSNLEGEGFAEIYSVNGMLIQKNKIDIVNGQLKLNFTGNNSLKPGLYLLKVSCNNQTIYTEKIVCKL